MYYPGKSKKAKRTKAKRGVRKPKKNLVRVVKSIIKRAAETKITSQEMVIGFGNNQQSPTMNVRTLSPSSAYMPIIQGPSQDERIGNKIQTKRAVLRYILHSLPYSASTNTAPCPMDVIMWFGRLKRSVDSPTSANFSNFFQYGSTSVAPVGDLSDINGVINKDYFTVLKKVVHKIGYAEYAGSGVNVGAQSYTNNDYKYNVVRKLDLTKCFAKTYIFNDSDNDPQNSRLYVWFEAIRADGLTGISTNVPCMFRGTIDYSYCDL